MKPDVRQPSPDPELESQPLAARSGKHDTLLALDIPKPFPEEAPDDDERDRVAADLDSNPGGVLWIRGHPGSGRSTLLGRAIEAHAARRKDLRGVLRIECWPGLRLEEIFEKVADFLIQAGIQELSETLGQRATVLNKIRMLIQLLVEYPVYLWLDDFQTLKGGRRRSGGSVARQFVETWPLLKNARGKLIVSTRRLGPEDISAEETSARVIDLSRETGITAETQRQYWFEHIKKTQGDVIAEKLPTLETISRHIRETPLALNHYFAAFACREAGVGLEVESNVVDALFAAEDFATLLARVRDCLTLPARGALDLLSIDNGPLSRGVFRSVAERLKLQDAETAGLDEIRAWGFLPQNSGDDRRLRLHPEVARLLQHSVRTETPGFWKRLHLSYAHHSLSAASRSRSLWHFYWAHLHLMKAEAFREAYEVQKTFLEDFLGSGYLELSKSVLEDLLEHSESPCREILLGNLAIIHKSEGDYQEAIRLYEQSLNEFVQRGDLQNVSRVYHQIGNTSYMKGDHDRALESYKLCLEIADRTGDAGVALLARIQMANILYSKQELEDSLEGYRTALELATTMKNEVMVTALRVQIGQAHLGLKRYAEAEAELLLAEELAVKREDQRNILKIQQVRGIMARDARDYDKASDRFEQAAKIAYTLGDPIEQANCEVHLASLDEERQRFSEAIKRLLSAHDLVEGFSVSPVDRKSLDIVEKNRSSIRKEVEKITEKLGRETVEKIFRRLGRKLSEIVGAGAESESESESETDSDSDSETGTGTGT